MRKKSSLRNHLVVPLFVTLIVSILSIIALLILMNRCFEDIKVRLAYNSKMAARVIEISQLRSNARETLLLYRFTRDADLLEDFQDINDKLRLHLEELHAFAQTYEMSSQRLEEFIAGVNINKRLEQQIIEAVKTGNMHRASRAFSDYGVLYRINTARLFDMRRVFDGQVRLASRFLDQLVLNLIVGGAFLILLTTFSFIVVFRTYEKRVISPLRELHSGLQAVREGDLETHLSARAAPSEIHEMTTDFNKMTHALLVSKKDLQRARHEAESVAEKKASFLSNMSHEIRTPLNTIVGMTDLIRESSLSPQVEKYVQVLKRNSEFLLELVNDILDLSRLEAGRIEPASDVVEIEDLISSALATIEPMATRKNLSLEKFIEPDLPPYIYGDRKLLDQVLINLLGNAVKFTEKGRIGVTIHSENDKDQCFLVLKVWDTGIGIPAQKLSCLFQRYSQADAGIKNKYGGTGLGLSIVKKIVELHSGQIEVHSRENDGTTFEVRIPLKKADIVRLPKRQGKNHQAGSVRSDLRILLVDDSEDNRFYIKVLLDPLHPQIVEAANGYEAIRHYKDQKFDLIFMDMQMPEMDGYQATKWIREIEKKSGRPKTPIFALSAFALQEEVSHSLEAGCDSHIIKPVRKSDLFDLLSRHFA